MPRCLIAVTDSPFPSLDPARAALARLDPELRMAKSASADDILEVARDADAVLVTYAKLPGELLAKLSALQGDRAVRPRCRQHRYQAATDLGMIVTYVPDYCMHEVSDHAMALLLALARKVPLLQRAGAVGPLGGAPDRPDPPAGRAQLRPGRLRQHPSCAGAEGEGIRHAGRAHDPYLAPEALAAAGVEGVSFDRLLETSDFVSVHAPLTPATRGLFDAAAFGKMKRGAMLINTARGPLVDEDALVAALESGHIGGAALDVVATEPLSRRTPR